MVYTRTTGPNAFPRRIPQTYLCIGICCSRPADRPKRCRPRTLFTGVAKSNVLALGSSNRDANPSSLFRAWRIRCSERCGSHLYLSCEYTTTGACKRVSRVVIHIHHQRVTKKSVDCIILGLTMYYFIVTVPPFCRRWSHHTTIMLLHL
jgi:hypothetical protein